MNHRQRLAAVLRPRELIWRYAFARQYAPMASTPSARKEALQFVIPLTMVLVAIIILRALFSVGFAFAMCLDALVLLLVLLVAFVLYFFRDPERYVPADESIIVAAADGLVVGIDEMEEPDFHLGPMIRVAIFLSVFDVHINRTPCDGTVKSTVYKAGKFLDVRHPQCSQLNEARSWWLETPHGNVAVRQIAGLIARRIVAWAGEGTPLQRGQRFGMIRFGSRTEIFLPPECIVLVKIGDRVEGAATPIAKWPTTE
jgi:phosphatidylserine decarboxylase